MRKAELSIFAKSFMGAVAVLGIAPLLGSAALAADAAHGGKTEVAAATAAAPAAGDAVAQTTRALQSASPQNAEFTKPTEMAPAMRLTVGKSALVRLPVDASRLSIGNPDIADVMLINPKEVYLLGKKTGSTNVFVWAKNGQTTIMDVAVGLDTTTLKGRLNELVPSETGVRVASLADSVVLSGAISDPIKLQRLMSLAEVYGGGKKVINLMSVDGSQQVMLEVKVAEVSKTLIDKLGVQFSASRSIGGASVSLLTQLLSGSAGVLAGSKGAANNTTVTLDAEVKNGLVKILAEPTIMAMSGQEGAFLAGGKIYIPVPQAGASGGTTITLEEKEFGVGLRFTPTVLEEGRINLRVTPEVSELSQIGTPVTTITGQTSVLPSITTRRASTTVQLRDGETFAIGGLIKNNVTEAIKAFPGLGELPILGALFRSNEFQTDRSELLFIITPRLVKPLPANYALPTDSFIQPTRADYLLNGRLEGLPPAAPATPAAPAAPAATAPAATDATPATGAGGFQLK